MYKLDGIKIDDKYGLVDLDSCPSHKLNALYSTSQVRQGLQDFYKNNNKLFDNYLEYWDYISDYFDGNDYILGYDILNEPMPAYLDGEDIKDATAFDEDVLLPLYDDIAETIRDNDDKKIIFFQPA
jgi:aryl-phospho-beta-D-glucosidase BglC (GH1 family)